ncbi:hypothetical protein ElyMa_006117900 [Elysia marginata]|uniref:Uncharacterized protein n=1 Tax=Elysia marginata TaxID=1093978 RepID=A0AAV4GW47_9GAST|nr:hypothetical protein ElyMa_006117900 [Elysia marginata]
MPSNRTMAVSTFPPRPPFSLSLSVPSVIIAKNPDRNRSSNSSSARVNTHAKSSENRSCNDNNNATAGSPSPTLSVPPRKTSADSGACLSGTESSPELTPVGLKPTPFSYASVHQGANKRNQYTTNAFQDTCNISQGGGAAYPAGSAMPIAELVIRAATSAAAAALSSASANCGVPPGTNIPVRNQPSFLQVPPPPYFPGNAAFDRIVTGTNQAGGPLSTLGHQTPYVGVPALTAPPTIPASFLDQLRRQPQGYEYGQGQGHGMNLTSETLKMSPCLRVEGSPCADDLGNYAMHVSQ